MSLIITKKFKRAKAQDAAAKDIQLPFIITFNNGKKEFREGYSEEEVRRRFDKSVAALYGGIKSVKLEDEDRRNGKDSTAAGDATTRKFKPNDLVEWRDAHGRHNSAFYVRDNGDRVTVSIEKDGQGGGLEIPKAWITNSRATDSIATDAKFKVGDRVKHAKVKFPVQPIGKISEVYDDPRWVEVEWENTPYKYQTIETSSLLPANSHAADACGTDAKLQKGDKVRVWQYPVYGKLGEVVEATYGGMEYTVNVEGKDYPRIDYRRIVKVSDAAGDAADAAEKMAQDSAIVALFQPLADAQAELRDGNKKSNAKNVLAAAIAAAEKEFKGNPFSSRDKRIIDDAKKVLAQFDSDELNNDADLRSRAADTKDSAATDAKFKVGDKVFLRGQGGGVCTIVRIGPKPAPGKYGANWAEETFDIKRDMDGVMFTGLVETDLRLAK